MRNLKVWKMEVIVSDASDELVLAEAESIKNDLGVPQAAACECETTCKQHDADSLEQRVRDLECEVESLFAFQRRDHPAPLCDSDATIRARQADMIFALNKKITELETGHNPRHIRFMAKLYENGALPVNRLKHLATAMEDGNNYKLAEWLRGLADILDKPDGE
jgi:hypothetical protein